MRTRVGRGWPGVGCGLWRVGDCDVRRFTERFEDLAKLKCGPKQPSDPLMQSTIPATQHLRLKHRDAHTRHSTLRLETLLSLIVGRAVGRFGGLPPLIWGDWAIGECCREGGGVGRGGDWGLMRPPRLSSSAWSLTSDVASPMARGLPPSSYWLRLAKNSDSM